MPVTISHLLPAARLTAVIEVRSMRFVDTHTHLYLPEFDGENPDAVTRAIEAGVDRMIFPNVDLTSVGPLSGLASRYPGNVYMAMGLHPTEVKEDWRDVLSEIGDILGDGRKYVAVGEIGVDLYWDKTFVDAQMQVFEKQVNDAVRLGLPVIIHCREGLDQTLEVLRGIRDVRAVFHSFGGTERDVEAIRKTGDFYFGINGVVTFKNSGLREVLPAIGIDRILLETDSPYLSPVPYRGKRNESARIPLIAGHIASLLDMEVDTVADVTTANAEAMFDIC